MPDYIPPAAKKIARQSVKPVRTINGTQRTGTQMPKVNGRTQGMPPDDWSAYIGTLQQKVTGDVYGHNGGSPRTQAVKNPPAGHTVKGADRDKAEDEKLIEQAKRRFKIADDAETSIRAESKDDLRFLVGEQWDPAIKQQRQTDQRPCLTINRLPQFVRSVTNEQRQNRPAIKVNPVDDTGDIETSEVLEGLCRHIEYDSGADAAYDTAFFHAAAAGYGFWRIITEYSEPLSFEQDIKIKRISNQFTVYLDPSAREPDFSDAGWGFLVEKLSKEKFKAMYPKADLATFDDWENVPGEKSDWITKDEVRVAEYFYKRNEPKMVVQFTDGSTYLKDELPEGFPTELIVRERETEITTVHWAKLNGHEVLEETEWPGKWIPIVKIIGDEYDIDGEIILKGIVRDAKDPQRQLNYMKSAATEAIALAPKAPFVGAEGQFEGHEREWQMANVKNMPYLQYKAMDVQGTRLPPPQRQTFEPAIQAINLATMEAADDMKAVTGVFDPALGMNKNDQSGKAIQALQAQSQGSNFHYIDNLSRGIRHTGKIILDLIPKIYDTERILRIIGEDGSQKTVPVNQEHEVDGVMKIFDLTVGKYDVTISTGPSYQTRRQEATATQLDLAKVFPPLMGVAGDIVIKNMDIPQAQEIAERVAATIPPNIKGSDGQDGQVPPQMQQMIAQLTDQNQKLSQELHGALDDLEQKKSEKAMDLESKERIEFAKIAVSERAQDIELLKIQATLAQSQATADAELSAQMAEQEYNAIDSHLDRIHEANMNILDHQQSLEAGAQSHAQGLESQQQAAELQPEPADATA